MSYIDGFVLVVFIVNKEKFFVYVCIGDLVFIEYGVLCVVECWGDDVLYGKIIDFFGVVKVMLDEMVVFFWIEWFDKLICDVGMKKMMEDSWFDLMKNLMLFDGVWMIYGGFVLIYELIC